MTTQRQIDANRGNAQASTGPRTEEGKKSSSMNAFRHGLTASEDWVLPTEDKEQHERLRERMLMDLKPVGPVEEELAREIVNHTWRLRRAESLELGLFAHGVSMADEAFFTERRKEFELTDKDVWKHNMANKGLDPDNVFAITNPELHEFLTDLIHEAVSVRRSDQGRLASAFVEDAAGPNAFAKFSRYETALFNRRAKLLEQLEALQAARLNAKGGETPSDE